MSIKRYVFSYYSGNITSRYDGEWVLYSDYKREIDELRVEFLLLLVVMVLLMQ